ncbi:unnamed protein product, partial [Ranitomeya imitator]
GPPTDLNFEIVNESTVRMSWQRPAERIRGYKITIVPTVDGPAKELDLPASATQTVLTELIPDVEYVVTILSYDESEESLPVFGQLTIQTGGRVTTEEKKVVTTDSTLKPGSAAGTPERSVWPHSNTWSCTLRSQVPVAEPGVTMRDSAVFHARCSISTVADVVFLVDGSWSVGRANFKYILDFMTSMVLAFDIGEDKTRVGVVQYSSDTRTEFNLNKYFKKNELLAAIKRIPYKGGNTMTGMGLTVYLLVVQ